MTSAESIVYAVDAEVPLTQSSGQQQPNQQYQQPSQPAGRSKMCKIISGGIFLLVLFTAAGVGGYYLWKSN